MADVTLDLGINTKAAVRGLKGFKDQAQGIFNSFALGVTGLNQGLSLLGKGFDVASSAIEATVAPALEFGQSLAEIQTLLEDGAVSTEELGDTILGLQKQFGGKQKKIATAYYDAISSGAVTASSAQEFLVTANKLAVGGVTDVSTAVDGLTTIINSFGLSADDTANISDSLFIAMQKGKTTVDQLSSSVGTAAPLASSLGVNFKELLASASALTTGGLTTSESFTQVKAALSGLSKPSADLQKAYDKLNITSIEAAISQDGLVGTLQKVVGTTDGSAESVGKLFGSVEAVGAVSALTSDTIGKTFLTTLGEMESASANAGTVSETAFQKIASDASFQFNKLQGIVSATFTEIGRAITKRIGPILKIAQSVAKNLGGAFSAGIEAASDSLSKSEVFSGDFFEKNLNKGIDIALKSLKLIIRGFKSAAVAALDFVLVFDDFIGVTTILEGIRQVAIKIAQGFLILKNAGLALAAIPAIISGNTEKLAELEAQVDKGRLAIINLQDDADKPLDFDFTGVREGVELLRDGIEDVGEAAEEAVGTAVETFNTNIKTTGDTIKDVIDELPESDQVVEIETEVTTKASKGFGKELQSEGLKFGTAAIGALKQGGEKGAEGIVSAMAPIAGTAIASFFGAPALGPIIGEALKFLLTDGAADMVTSIIDNIPTIIERFAFNMPTVAIALASAFLNPLFYVRMANAFVDGLTKGIDEVATDFVETFKFSTGEGFIDFKNQMGGFGVEFREKMDEGLNEFVAGVKEAWPDIRDTLLSPFTAISEIVDGITTAFDNLYKTITGGGGVGGKVKATGRNIAEAIGLQSGGTVPAGFPNDTFPARLTSGETVVSQDTSKELAAFLGRQANVEALLGQLVSAVKAPMQVQTIAEVDGTAFADIQLELSRQGARTA